MGLVDRWCCRSAYVLINHHSGPQEAIDEIRNITYSDFCLDSSYVLWLIQEVMASGSLALCLTEVPDSLLMWAHYASFHKGFVVGFDITHEFFTCPNGGYLFKRINYQKIRPNAVFPNPNPEQVYFTKSIEWEYEKEWRLFKKFFGDKPVDVDSDSFPIYLFDLPADTLKEVILGCRMDPSLRQSISDFVKIQYPRVMIKSAELSEDKYALTILTGAR